MNELQPHRSCAETFDLFAAAARLAATVRVAVRTHARPKGPAAALALLVVCALCPAGYAHAQSGLHNYTHYSIAALLLAQTVMIVILLLQGWRRRREQVDVESLRTQLTHAARLALAGEITASIAHEVTQPLSAILSNVETIELLLHGPQHGDPAVISEILADIKRDDLRANEIVRRLRTLLRRRELHFEPTDVNATVLGVMSLIRSDAMRREITVRLNLEPTLPQVAADPIHLQQVMLNLLLNAMDAMNDMPREAKRIELRTRLTPAGTIEVSVVDSGHGIAPEKLAAAFESFFTTKEHGMGLGLSIARSIVQAHGGTIWAENREPSGAAFHFTLPLRESSSNAWLRLPRRVREIAVRQAEHLSNEAAD